MCSCGNPRWECHHKDNAGLYEVQSVVCHAQAAVDEHTRQKDFKPEPGERFYATPIDDDLVTRRPLTTPRAGSLTPPQ